MTGADIIHRLCFLASDAGIYGIVALGLAMAFRVVRFPDLTAEGSFVFGAVACYLTTQSGAPTWLAIFAASIAGATSGVLTAGFSVIVRVPTVLCGILTWMGLYTVNLHLLGSPNALMARDSTTIDSLYSLSAMSSPGQSALFVAVVFLATSGVLWCILESRAGMNLRCAAANPFMAASLGIPIGLHTILGLGMANGLIGLAGGLFALKAGYVDVNMGSGMLVAGIAPLFLGSALFVSARADMMILSCAVGAILYRGIVGVALELGLDPRDLRLGTTILVLVGFALLRLRGQQQVTLALDKMFEREST